MLQFWKKSGQKEESRSNSSSPVKSTPPNSPTFSNLNGIHSNSNSFESGRSGLLASFEDEGLFDISETEVPKERSRLTKTLQEVLLDKSALGYFVQYLESRGALPYIHCLLDIRHLKCDVEKFCESTKCEQCDSSNLLSPLPSTKVEHDSLSVSTDCDSLTADSSSLVDYSSITVSDKQTAEAKNVQHDATKLDVNSICDKNSSDIINKVNADSCKYEIKFSFHSECNREERGLSDTSDKTYTHDKSIQILVEEALVIFKNYVSLEATENIKCTEEIRKEVIENVCNVNKILDCTCFDKVEKHVAGVLECDYIPAFLGTDYFCKHQIDVLTSGNVVLEDILYNETALFYFMEFLEQENNRSLLEFWIAATNFQQQLHDQKEFFDPVEAQNDAVVLYDKYFSLQAHCPLGFSDKIRFAVEQSICGENGVVLDCFHLPLKIVEQVLEKNYLKPFVASQLFYKYLSELINAVHTNGYSNVVDGHKRTPSDCSSEKSFSTNSTFLAMEVPNYRYKREKKGTDMNIDTRQLYDPDSLWKRRKHRLSFGRITSLGKYETDFEPEPDKSTQSKLRNVVKKFVSLDEDKKREEMAWQVAEMIVKDITNVTLNDHKQFPC